MKRVLSSLLVLFLLAAGSTWLGMPKTHEQQVRDYINNTVTPAVTLMYEEDDKGHKDFACTATAFSREKDGYLFLTAAHCVVFGDGGRIFLSPDSKNPEIYYPAQVVAYGDINQDLDYAVLYVEAPNGTFPVVALGHNPVQPGERIISVSAPAGVGKAVLRGTVSLTALPRDEVMEENGFHDNWKGDILFSMPGGFGGSSGSSIICEDQMAVCAIYVGHTPYGQIAQPIEKFKRWWSAVQDGYINPTPPIPAKVSEKDIIDAIIKAIGGGHK